MSITPSELAALAESIATAVADRLANQPRLIDRHALAVHLGVSVPTIDRLRRNGQITSISVGSRILFDPNSVIEDLREVDHE